MIGRASALSEASPQVARPRAHGRPRRVAIVADYAEEHWPSMDRMAETLAERLAANHAAEVTPVLVRPPFHYRFTAPARTDGRALLVNADRLVNRFLDYPAALRGLRAEFDLFHIVDHSYAHLVHALPADRTCVTCHDLDTFRSVLEPEREPRGALFRMMTRRILSGLERAAMIACDSQATRDELLRWGIVEASRTTVIHAGVSAVFNPAPDAGADAEAARMLGAGDPSVIELLHVGAPVVRKRLDLLLRVISALRRWWPTLRLIRVGGPFTAEQQKLANELGVAEAITVLPRVSDAVLAAVYRRSALVLMPSDAEGFGLPLLEALACGTPVLASAIAALREVGGGAAEYAPSGNLEAWTGAAERLLRERQNDAISWTVRCRRARGRAAQFSWDESAATTIALYRALAAVEL
jgi:glycosyltransferase involved in cell wall biosynthesis